MIKSDIWYDNWNHVWDHLWFELIPALRCLPPKVSISKKFLPRFFKTWFLKKLLRNTRNI